MEQAKHQQLPYGIGPFFSYENISSCVTNVLHKEKIKNYFRFTLFCNTFVTHNFVYLLHNIKNYMNLQRFKGNKWVRHEI